MPFVKHKGMAFKKNKIWVVKAGSNAVCSGGPLQIRDWMQQVAYLKKQYGIQVVWVTSGAIATAVDRTQVNRTKKNISEKQALSAIGQPLVMDLYNIALQTQGLLGAQVLLTYENLKNKEQFKNFKNTISQLLKWGSVPVINENDAVATAEIQFGDNDCLSAEVAVAIKAERLIILTDVDGLYHSDPRKNKNAQQIFSLEKVTTQLLKKVAPEGGTERGTGGMYTKLKASKIANKSKILSHLARGSIPGVLIKIANGDKLGTLIGKKVERLKTNAL